MVGLLKSTVIESRTRLAHAKVEYNTANHSVAFFPFHLAGDTHFVLSYRDYESLRISVEKLQTTPLEALLENPRYMLFYEEVPLLEARDKCLMCLTLVRQSTNVYCATLHFYPKYPDGSLVMVMPRVGPVASQYVDLGFNLYHADTWGPPPQ